MNHEAQPSLRTKRRINEEDIMTQQTFDTRDHVLSTFDSIVSGITYPKHQW